MNRRQTRSSGLSGIFYTALIILLAYIAYLNWQQNIASGAVPMENTDRSVGIAPVIEPEILRPHLLPTFPGAEGAGAATPGGRGGRVIEVTNLNDSGPGSLREAVSTRGPRIVVFRVAGVIELTRPLLITEPYLTIAGQTAPGSGITLSGVKNEDGEMIFLRDVHDVVIQYIRIRNGQGGEPGQGQTNIAIDSGTRNILIDHVSLSWSLDENLMIHRNIPEGEDPETWPGISNITIQRSIIAEGLHPHSTGIEIGGESQLEGWREVRDITIHHNLFAHNSHRNPGVGSLHTQIINNVMYNWGSRIGSTWRNIDVDWIGNYFKRGPMSARGNLLLHASFPANEPFNPWPAPSLFVGGNLVLPDSADPGRDNWEMYVNHYTFQPLPEDFRREQPLPFTTVPVEIDTAVEAYESVLADVGANARLACDGSWINNQDDVDKRLISDVIAGTGPVKQPISSAEEVGGLPALQAGTACADSDHDGMPDVWEAARPELNPQKYDANGNDLHPSYTNIEVFLNGTPRNERPGEEKGSPNN